jgi:acetyl esterase
MPLNPQTQALLEQLAASGAPPLHELSVAEARQVIVDLFAAPGEPEPVGKVTNRHIPGAEGDIPIRIYTPEGNGPFPILVYFHGGGWVIGNLDAYDPTCRVPVTLSRYDGTIHGFFSLGHVLDQGKQAIVAAAAALRAALSP